MAGVKSPPSTNTSTAKATRQDHLLYNILVASFAAMLVATPLLPSDTFSLASDGQIAAPAMLWLMLALCSSAAWLLRTFRTASSSRCWTFTDLILAAFFVWVAVAGVVASVDGNRRASWNMTASWVSLGITYYLTRSLLRDGRTTRAFVIGAIAVCLMFAAEGLNEAWITIPQDQARFRHNPAAVLAEAGVAAEPGSAAYNRFKSRLETQGPSGTFALENSLAGFLIPAAILILGMLVLGKNNSEDKGRRMGIPVLFTGFSLLAICIYYTHSTAAIMSVGISLLVGMIVILFGDPKPTSRVMRYSALAILSIIFVWPFAIGFLSDSVREGLPRTIQFRCDYWQSCQAMLFHRPLWGCGPGNFQDAYPQHMLPRAAETIADPHNLVWEVFCNSGLIGGLLLVSALMVAARSPIAHFLLRFPTSSLEDASKSKDEENQASLRLVAFGALGGIALALLLALSSGSNFLIMFSRSWLLWGTLPAGILVVTMLPWVRYGKLPPSLIWLAWLGLAMHLTVSGGISNPGTGTLFFFLLALTQNFAQKSTLSGATTQCLAGGFVLVSLMITAIAHYQWGYLPVLAAQASFGQYELAMSDAKLGAAKEALINAAKSDRWTPVPLAKLTQLELASYLDKEPNVQADPEKLISSAKEATTRSPNCPSLHFELAMNLLRANSSSRNPDLLNEAKALLTKATELAPSNGVIWGYRAYAESLENDLIAARKSASQAIRLDSLNPHYDLAGEPSPIPGRSFAGWLRELARAAN